MFKKIEELLEAGKLTKEVAEALDAEVSTAMKSLRDENAQYRTKNKELSQSLEEITNSKSELEKQLGDLDKRIEKAREDGKGELVTQLEAEKAEKDKLKETLNAISEKNRELTIQNTIQSALSEYDVIDAELVQLAVKQHIELGEDGTAKFKNGDAILPVQDGLKQFFENKPQLLKSAGSGGSGAGAVGNGTAKLTKAEFLSKSPAEQAEITSANPNILSELE